MQTFIMLTRLVSEEINPSFAIQKKEKDVVEKIHQHCPEVEWIHNYATFGPWDYVDIFNAPNMETAMKVSLLVRTYAGTHTEIWPAARWNNYKDIVSDLNETITQQNPS